MLRSIFSIIRKPFSRGKEQPVQDAGSIKKLPEREEIDTLSMDEKIPSKQPRPMMDSGEKESSAFYENFYSRRKHRIAEMTAMTNRLAAISSTKVGQMVKALTNLGFNLDICFCIDGTGSMSGCIANVKKCIVRVSRQITSLTGMNARFALVVYRDYCDKERHQVWDFGSSENVEKNLEMVVASGGGDEPEDCFGGIWMAINKATWKAPQKIIIWMGDAPQHGLQYNGGLKDDHPGSDPDGRTAVGLFEQLRSRQIMLIFCKLTGLTDAMCAQLHTEAAPYGSSLFQDYDVNSDMETFLIKTIYETSSLTSAFGTSARGQIKPLKLVNATWNVDELWGSEEAAEVFTFLEYRNEDFDPLLDLVLDGPDVKLRPVRCRMTLNPFQNGEMKFAFYGKIAEIQVPDNRLKKCVTKTSRFMGSHNSRSELVNQAHIQAVAAFLAREFSARIKNFEEQRKLIYVPMELVHIPSRPEGDDYFLLEPFISGDYVKFNNNSGYVNKPLEAQHPLLQTFSHFTFDYSNGIVTVVDLQGVVDGITYRLTDPAIHTADPKNCLKDPTNKGHEGMSAFFKSHTCNEWCQSLMLKRPDGVIRMPPLRHRDTETEAESIDDLYSYDD